MSEARWNEIYDRDPIGPPVKCTAKEWQEFLEILARHGEFGNESLPFPFKKRGR